MRPGVAILAAAILALPARALAADKEPTAVRPEQVAFRLEYKPRPTCVARDDFLTWLSSEFGYQPVRDDARALVRVEVKRNGPLWEARVLALDESGGVRWKDVVPTPIDCRELIQNTALSLSINLGKWELKGQAVPAWLLRREPVEVGAPAPSPPPRVFVAILPPAPQLVGRPTIEQSAASETEERERGPRLRLEFGASGLVVPYGLPSIGFGGAISLIGRWRALSAVIEPRGVTSLTTEVRGRPLQSTLWSVIVAPCVDAQLGLSACGVINVGRVYHITGAGVDYVDPIAVTTMLGARLTFTYPPSGKVKLYTYADGMIPLSSNPLVVEKKGDSIVIDPLRGAVFDVGVGVAFNFWRNGD